MNERTEHFDEDLGLHVSPKLSADLSTLFEPERPVPPEVNGAVSERIHKHFIIEKAAEGKHRRFRWAALWRVAAAAAVVILAFSLDLTKEQKPTTDRPVLAGIRATDIDLNGRVDIIDAFTLARQIKEASHIETRWDINGDGLVDHSDVDMVALAAVRLDKGVL